MPVIKRSVEPIYVSRGEIPREAKNGLEAVAVNTLSGVIYQLSSLAYHAENIFAELFKEATGIFERTCNAQRRIEQLAVKVTKLDSAEEEISLQDINLQKAFKMTIHYDSQVTSRSTIPDAMLEVYENSEPVPNLNSLNKFRDDGKMSLKFYTDPSYFFELWKEKMNKELENRKKKKKKGRVKKQQREENKPKAVKKKTVKNVPTWELTGTKTVTSETMPSHEPEMPRPSHDLPDIDSYPPPPPPDISADHAMKRTSRASSIGRPSSVPPPPPYESPVRGPAPPPPPPLTGQAHQQPAVPPPPPPPQQGDGGFPLPPPPPPEMQTGFVPAPPPPPPATSVVPPPPPPPGMPGVPQPPSTPNAPPPPGPPPPPLPPMQTGSPAAPAPPPPQQGLVIPTERNLKPVPPKEPEPEDSRNDLLAAIRKGMNLKKAQERKLNEKKDDKQTMDVASILARRIAMELSDSDEDDGSEDDGSGWSTDS